jgi:hypothetical protein
VDDRRQDALDRAGVGRAFADEHPAQRARTNEVVVPEAPLPAPGALDDECHRAQVEGSICGWLCSSTLRTAHSIVPTASLQTVMTEIVSVTGRRLRSFA